MKLETEAEFNARMEVSVHEHGMVCTNCLNVYYTDECACTGMVPCVRCQHMRSLHYDGGCVVCAINEEFAGIPGICMLEVS